MNCRQRLSRELHKKRRYAPDNPRHLGFIAWFDLQPEHTQERWRQIAYTVVDCGLNLLAPDSGHRLLGSSEFSEILSHIMRDEKWRVPTTHLLAEQLNETPESEFKLIIDFNRALLSLRYYDDTDYWVKISMRVDNPVVDSQSFTALMLYRPRDAFEWLSHRAFTPALRRALPIAMANTLSHIGRTELTEAVTSYISVSPREDGCIVREVAEALGLDTTTRQPHGAESTPVNATEEAVLEFVKNSSFQEEDLHSRIGLTLATWPIVKDCIVANLSSISEYSPLLFDRWMAVARAYPSSEIVFYLLTRAIEFLETEDAQYQHAANAITRTIISMPSIQQQLLTPHTLEHIAFSRQTIALARMAVGRLPVFEDCLHEFIKLFSRAGDDTTVLSLMEIALASSCIDFQQLWGRLAQSTSRDTLSQYCTGAMDRLLENPSLQLELSPDRGEYLRRFLSDHEIEDGYHAIVRLNELKFQHSSPVTRVINSVEPLP